MPLSVRCEHCSHILSVPDKAIGKRVQCSRCKTIFIVSPQNEEEEEFRLAPLSDEKPKPIAPTPKAASRSVPVTPQQTTPQSPEKITFACVSCGHVLKAPSTAIGKKVKCSCCQMVQTMPAELPVLDLGLFVPQTPKPMPKSELDSGLFAPPPPELDTGLFAPPTQAKSMEDLFAMELSSDPFANIPMASSGPPVPQTPPRVRRSGSRHAPIGDVFAGTFRVLGRHFGDFFLMGLKFFFCSFGMSFLLGIIIFASFFVAALAGMKNETVFVVVLSAGLFMTGMLVLLYITACMLGGNNTVFRLTAGKSAGALFGFDSDHYWKAVGCNFLLGFCALAIAVPIHFATFKESPKADFHMESHRIALRYQEEDFGSWTFGQTDEQTDDTEEDSGGRTVRPPRNSRPSVPRSLGSPGKFFDDEEEKETQKAEEPSGSFGRNVPAFPAPQPPKSRFVPPQPMMPETFGEGNAPPQEERQRFGKFIEPRNIPFQHEQPLSEEDKARMVAIRCGERIGAFVPVFNLIHSVLTSLMLFVYIHIIDRNLSAIDAIIQAFAFFWCNFGSVFLGGLVFYALPVCSIVVVSILLGVFHPVLGGLCAFFGCIFICVMIFPCCCCFAVVTYRVATYGEVK